jgi:hypothetical protein
VILKDERGFAVMAAAALLVSLGIAALVIDYGLILANRSQISTAADAAALAGAQELPNQDAARTVASNYVAINASRVPNIAAAVTFPAGNVIRVRTSSGSPLFFSRVLGLTDFSIGSVAESTRFDPNVAIIIDRSGSMCVDSYPAAATTGICPEVGPWEPFSTVQQIANNFVDQFKGNPTFTLISFSSYATLDAALTQDRVAIKAAINNLRPGGTTDIAASLRTSIDQLLLSTGKNPNLIVLLTDGVPNTVNGVYYGDNDPGARQGLIDAADMAHDKGMIIYGINYGMGADNTLMRQVAEATDGSFYYAPNDGLLQNIYAEIGAKAYIRLTYVN